MLLPTVAFNLGFAALTLVTVAAFFFAAGRDKYVLIALSAWLMVVAGISLCGFFLDSTTVPPRVALVILPMLLVGLLLGFSKWGAALREVASLEYLQYFQGIRIVVEVLFLHGLYEAGYIARVMTYAGYNFDIVPGLLGPAIGYLAFCRKTVSYRWAIAYQYLGIAVLTSTIILAVLSTPSPYQQLGFDRPTVAIFYFPFIWLPALVAPLMLWAHFISLRKLSTFGIS